jgi:hypothetical protein
MFTKRAADYHADDQREPNDDDHHQYLCAAIDRRLTLGRDGRFDMTVRARCARDGKT